MRLYPGRVQPPAYVPPKTTERAEMLPGGAEYLRFQVQGHHPKRRYWEPVAQYSDLNRALADALKRARISKVAYRVWDRDARKELWRGYGYGATVDVWMKSPPAGLIGRNSRDRSGKGRRGRLSWIVMGAKGWWGPYARKERAMASLARLRSLVASGQAPHHGRLILGRVQRGPTGWEFALPGGFATCHYDRALAAALGRMKAAGRNTEKTTMLKLRRNPRVSGKMRPLQPGTVRLGDAITGGLKLLDAGYAIRVSDGSGWEVGIFPTDKMHTPSGRAEAGGRRYLRQGAGMVKTWPITVEVYQGQKRLGRLTPSGARRLRREAVATNPGYRRNAASADEPTFFVMHVNVDGAGIHTKNLSKPRAIALAQRLQARSDRGGNPWGYRYIVYRSYPSGRTDAIYRSKSRVANNPPRAFYTLKRRDVGRFSIRAFGRTLPVSDFIGRVLPHDVGKRVYCVGGICQVENDQQFARRTGRKVNPLTRREAGRLLRDGRYQARQAGLEHDLGSKAFRAGRALQAARTVLRHGPKTALRAAVRVSAMARGRFSPARGMLDNPRQAHTAIVSAFLGGQKKKVGPRYWTDGRELRVWGHLVAEKGQSGIALYDAGYQTRLTQAVLKTILDMLGRPRIQQKARQWYMGSERWTGSAVIPFGAGANARRGRLRRGRVAKSNPSLAFDVYLRGKWIDRVFYSASARVTPDDVRRSLVGHDRYDPAIVVRRGRGFTGKKKTGHNAPVYTVHWRKTARGKPLKSVPFATQEDGERFARSLRAKGYPQVSVSEVPEGFYGHPGKKPMTRRNNGTPSLTLSVHTNESTGKRMWAVLYGGSPICADTTEERARKVLDEARRKTPRAKVTLWDGDAGKETALPNRRRSSARRNGGAWYYGHKKGGGVEKFWSRLKPTQKSHGHRYLLVTGPFGSPGAMDVIYGFRWHSGPHTQVRRGKVVAINRRRAVRNPRALLGKRGYKSAMKFA